MAVIEVVVFKYVFLAVDLPERKSLKRKLKCAVLRIQIVLYCPSRRHLYSSTVEVGVVNAISNNERKHWLIFRHFS